MTTKSVVLRERTELRVSLVCEKCAQPIGPDEKSVSDFIGQHYPTESCRVETDHWHVCCQPPDLHYRSSEYNG